MGGSPLNPGPGITRITGHQSKHTVPSSIRTWVECSWTRVHRWRACVSWSIWAAQCMKNDHGSCRQTADLKLGETGTRRGQSFGHLHATVARNCQFLCVCMVCVCVREWVCVFARVLNVEQTSKQIYPFHHLGNTLLLNLVPVWSGTWENVRFRGRRVNTG